VVLPPEAEALQPLAMWAGGLVLITYVLLFCGLGARFVLSRDVT
jgi:hypothetical protein